MEKDEYFKEDVYFTLVPSFRTKNEFRMKKFTNHINRSLDLTENTHTHPTTLAFMIGISLIVYPFFGLYITEELFYIIDVIRKTQFNLNIPDMRQVPKIKLEISILKMAQYQLVIQPALPNFFKGTINK